MIWSHYDHTEKHHTSISSLLYFWGNEDCCFQVCRCSDGFWLLCRSRWITLMWQIFHPVLSDLLFKDLTHAFFDCAVRVSLSDSSLAALEVAHPQLCMKEHYPAYSGASSRLLFGTVTVWIAVFFCHCWQMKLAAQTRDFSVSLLGKFSATDILHEFHYFLTEWQMPECSRRKTLVTKRNTRTRANKKKNKNKHLGDPWKIRIKVLLAHFRKRSEQSTRWW